MVTFNCKYYDHISQKGLDEHSGPFEVLSYTYTYDIHYKIKGIEYNIKNIKFKYDRTVDSKYLQSYVSYILSNSDKSNKWKVINHLKK